MEDPPSLLLAGHWPKGWPETYMRKRYMQVDPTVRYLGHAQAGFRWRDTLGAFRLSPHRKRMERMMVDARQNGLQDGYIFPVHGRRGLLGMLSLGGRPVDLREIDCDAVYLGAGVLGKGRKRRDEQAIGAEQFGNVAIGAAIGQQDGDMQAGLNAENFEVGAACLEFGDENVSAATVFAACSRQVPLELAAADQGGERRRRPAAAVFQR